MGKIASIYLTDEESDELKKFCEENQCTQYSAIKIALKELLTKPVKATEVPLEKEIKQETIQSPGNTEGTEKKEETSTDVLRRLLKYTRKKDL